VNLKSALRHWLGSTEAWAPRAAELIEAGAECTCPANATQLQSITSTIAYVVNGSRVGHSRKGLGIIGVSDVSFHAAGTAQETAHIDMNVTLPGQRDPTKAKIILMIEAPGASA
jgi:hypothetical protein